jgi:hypothetical protein
MRKAIGHVLRSDEVRLEGQLNLSVLQSEPNHTNAAMNAGAQTASIVQDHSEFAVIKITCSCGATMYLRCEYSKESSSAEDSNSVSQ